MFQSVIEGSKNGDRIFQESEKTKINSSLNRQYGSPNLFSKNRGNKKRRTKKFFEKHLEIFASKRDHNYCRISPKCSEYSSGLALVPFKAFWREWKLCFQILLKISKILDQPCVNVSASRLSHELQAYIFQRHISSARQWIHFNEAGDTSFLGRPNHLPYNHKGLIENTRGQGHNDFSCSYQHCTNNFVTFTEEILNGNFIFRGMLEVSVMVSVVADNIRNQYKKPNFVDEQGLVVYKPLERFSPFDKARSTQTCDMAGFQKRME